MNDQPSAPANKRPLWIDPKMGMAGDMFAAALLALGASEFGMIAAMKTAAACLGDTSIRAVHCEAGNGTTARQIRVDAAPRTPMSIGRAPEVLEEALQETGIRGSYAGLAQRALAILCRAERFAHEIIDSGENNKRHSIELTTIGTAHTPFHERAPYQPHADSESAADDFCLVIEPEFTPGLAGLGSFSHIYVLSHLERSSGYSMTLSPPWKNDGERYGLFATRTPNRPSPIGLTRTKLRHIEGARIFTGPLDLLDGTPILDIKPYIKTLDGDPGDAYGSADVSNDGWLAGSDHIELHRRGVPHHHPGGGKLHEAQDIVVDVVGAAWGLKDLSIDLDCLECVAPVWVGGGTTGPTSHGELGVPAPATQAILDQYEIPYAAGPVEAELLTPTGAAILAALSPRWISRLPGSVNDSGVGVGLGRGVFSQDHPNELKLFLGAKSES